MALIVEDGSGLSTAESYASVAEFDTYLTETSKTTSATTAQKEAALRIATRYLDGLYQWRGQIKVSTQALGWPRLVYYDSDGRQVTSIAVPEIIKDAACEAAFAHLTNALNPTVTSGSTVTREKVGSLEVEYASWASPVPKLPYITSLLRPLILAGAGSMSARLVRV